jgi:hypothetical protein
MENKKVALVVDGDDIDLIWDELYAEGFQQVTYWTGLIYKS